MSEQQEALINALAKAQTEFDRDAHIPHWGKHLSEAALSALWDRAEERVMELTLNVDGFPIVDRDTVHVILNTVLGPRPQPKEPND